MTEGSITACSPGDHGNHRYLSLSPGMSADAVADLASVLHVLGKDALERIARDDPELARRITTNIAVHLSERLTARRRRGSWPPREASCSLTIYGPFPASKSKSIHGFDMGVFHDPAALLFKP